MSGVPRPADFLAEVTGYLERRRTSSADRPIRLATVDPGYSPFLTYPDPTPAARVVFDGEDTLSGKAYPIAQGFIPQGGQRVFMLPIGNGYLISGAVNALTPQGFWQESDGSEGGVELGGGNYFDTITGLYLETDLTVLGTVTGKVARGLVRGATFTDAQVTAGSTVEKVMDHFTDWVPESGRRYELRWMTVGQGSVASDAFAIRFKHQATTGPLTTAGTQFMRLDVNGAALAVPHQYVWPVPALPSGTPHAVGVTVQRVGGTGTWAANSAGTGRRLEIHDVGQT